MRRTTFTGFRKILMAVFLLSFISCDVADSLVQVVNQNMPLTEQEVVSGLKEALKVSTDTAVSVVSAINGYYKDNLIKILLPPEADVIVQNKNNALLQAAGITKFINDAELSLNRAAENAAKSATPIFINAVKSMTINDAFNILNGSDTAATHYFRQKTYNHLKNTFKPQIKKSLKKPLVHGISADKAWSTLADTYNEVAAMVPGWKKVNVQLDEYVTKKALNGLFIKIAEQEKQIRTNPSAQVTDILKRVFGEKITF